MTPIEAAEYVRLLRYELALAISDSSDARDGGAYGHVVWHNFQPWFGHGNLEQWRYEIREILHPALRQDPQWVFVAELLVPAIKWLSIIDDTFYRGCSRCS